MFGWEGKREKKGWSPGVYSSSPLDSFLPKIGRKLFLWLGGGGGGDSDLFIDQDAHVHLHMCFCQVCWLFFSQF